MKPSPPYSIIMPTFQRREMVCDAVRALCRLSYDGPIEIIVVVDGSIDGTAAALAGIDCSFPLRVIEQENRGQAAARNRGATEAIGEVLLFLDDDMICERNVVQQHARFHGEGADAVTGEIPIHPDSEPGIITERLTTAASWKRGPQASPFDVYSGHFSIKADAFREIGGFDTQMQDRGYGAEDLDLGIRLSKQFDVRHNREAVAWQKNLISPSEYMKRARQLAASDLRLMTKHPDITKELLAHRGAQEGVKIPLALRLSRVPGLPSALAGTAVWLADIAQRTRFRSSRRLAWFYFTARSTAYWSTFLALGGDRILRNLQRD
ncbi:MAG: glycosyltransferase family 2 protein [Pseudomonadota bacterium]